MSRSPSFYASPAEAVQAPAAMVDSQLTGAPELPIPGARRSG